MLTAMFGYEFDRNISFNIMFYLNEKFCVRFLFLIFFLLEIIIFQNYWVIYFSD